MKYRKTKVKLMGLKGAFDAYVSDAPGDTFNGQPIPAFTLKQAKKLIKAYNRNQEKNFEGNWLFYHKPSDSVVHFEGDGLDNYYKDEIYTQDGEKDVYLIGLQKWLWDEVE